MSLIGFAFVVGIIIAFAERKAIAATRLPAPCHACWSAGEIRMTHWNGSRWVHDDTGGDAFTQIDIDAESLGIRVTPHAAIPRTVEDERRTPNLPILDPMPLAPKKRPPISHPALPRRFEETINSQVETTPGAPRQWR